MFVIRAPDITDYSTLNIPQVGDCYTLYNIIDEKLDISMVLLLHSKWLAGFKHAEMV